MTKTAKLLRWIDKNIYCRHIYQPHMKLVHYFGFHWFTRIRTMPGQPMLRCSWCGEIHVIYRKGLPEQLSEPNAIAETPCQTKQ